MAIYCFFINLGKAFLFDSPSINKEGSFVESGSSILLGFKTLSDVEKYIKIEYAKHILNFSDTQFYLQYIKRTTESTSASSILSSVNKEVLKLPWCDHGVIKLEIESINKSMMQTKK